MKVRLILDAPHRGAWNMAVDEALLASTREGSTPTLRIYGWSEPTLSLGYFQKYADRHDHPASARCAVVRRPSGGGAILHDREWTYSFTLPTAQGAAFDRRRLYRVVHAALVDALNARGVPAAIHQNAQNQVREPFLCFQRRSQGDVVLGDHKICGSAQRRGKSAVLQHGSILLSASPAAPELLGINELTKAQIAPEELQREWLHRLAAALEATFEEGQLSQKELDAAVSLETRQHAAASWIERR